MNTMTKGDFMRRINRIVREAFIQAAQNPENTVRSREEEKKNNLANLNHHEEKQIKS